MLNYGMGVMHFTHALQQLQREKTLTENNALIL